MKKIALNFMTFSLFSLFLSCAQPQTDKANDEAKEETEEETDFWYQNSAEFLEQVITNSSGDTIVYPEGQATISSRFVVWKPGFETPMHKHPVPIAVAIYQGELTVEFENGDTLVTKAGGSYVSTPNLWHKSTNKGTEDLIFHLVYMGTDQAEHTVLKE